MDEFMRLRRRHEGEVRRVQHGHQAWGYFHGIAMASVTSERARTRADSAARKPGAFYCAQHWDKDAELIVVNTFFHGLGESDLKSLGVHRQYAEVLDAVAKTQVLIKKCKPGEFLNGTIPIKRRLDRAFADRRWLKEQPRVPEEFADSGYSNMDWQKEMVGIEIQVTANTSRMLNDFRRIEIACERGLIKVGIELTLMLETARMCTDRIAFFEDGVKYVQRFRNARCVVIGLAQDGFGPKALPKQMTRQGRGEGITQPDFDAE